TVGAGASLSAIYKFLAPRGLAVAAGGCPAGGGSGDTFGGGYRLPARPIGLTAHKPLSIHLLDAQGQTITGGPPDDADLFWACRGGGGGSFGAATQFAFRVYRLPNLAVFGASWQLPIERAIRLFQAWQKWAPNAAAEITASLKVMSRGSNAIGLHCF